MDSVPLKTFLRAWADWRFSPRLSYWQAWRCIENGKLPVAPRWGKGRLDVLLDRLPEFMTELEIPDSQIQGFVKHLSRSV